MLALDDMSAADPHDFLDGVVNREQPEKLTRSLGAWGVGLLAVNGLVGAGIFGLPGGAAGLAGEYSAAVYLVCALLMLPIVLCFAEAASYFHGTGGPVRYADAAFGPFLGFQAGWLLYVSSVGGLAANSVLLVDNVGFFWSGAVAGSGRLLLLALIWLTLIALNVIGSVGAIRALAALTVLKLAVLLSLVGAGVAYFGADLLPSVRSEGPGASEFGAATLLLVYAFAGFESAVVPGGETRRPARDMPAGLLWTLGGVALLYVLIQLVSMRAVPDLATSTSPLLDAANALMGTAGSVILMFGVVASVGGNLFRGAFAVPRVTYAMARDNCLPPWFGTVHERFRTPLHSIVFFGLVSFVLAAHGSFIWLATAAVLPRLLVYSVVCAATPRLRRGHARVEGFVLPWGCTLPWIGLAVSVGLMLGARPAAFLGTLGVVASGSLLYGIERRRTRRAGVSRQTPF